MLLLFIVGIQPWEDMYDEMAKAMGIDPSVRISFAESVIIFVILFVDKEVCAICTH